MATVDTAIGGKFTLAAESIMAGMITDTYTAFEVLVKDLWEAAVNLKPDTLFKTKARDAGKSGPSVSLKIEISDLISANYSLRENIAKFAKRQFDIKLQKYKCIKDAYKVAFGRVPDSLDTDKNRWLFSLSQTRNAIVHSAGIADKQFMEMMVNIDDCIPHFSGLTEGKKIPLNGEVVSLLVNESISSCALIARDIDDWVSG